MLNYENLWDRYILQEKNIWKSVIKEDGIKVVYSPKEFLKSMDDIELKRVNSILSSGLISTPTISNKNEEIDIKKLIKNSQYEDIADYFKETGLSNYFIINDITQGEICGKCGTYGIVVLIMDSNYTENLDEKIFLPGLETYMVMQINPEDEEFVRNFPIPINNQTDYWYCPNCKELHKFSFDESGLVFNQEVIKI